MIQKSSLATSANLPQPREVVMPDFTSNTIASFNGTITGDITAPANMLAVWSPRETRFVLRGGYALVICTTATAGTAGPAILSFYDELLAQPVLPLGVYQGTGSVAGDLVCGTWPVGVNTGAGRQTAVAFKFDLGRGYRSLAKNNRLLIGGGLGIAGGVLRCAGVVWGVQE